MLYRYFGQYLLNEGILTLEQMNEILTFEQSARVLLGLLAINEGIMTANQVEEINMLQRQTDRRFGELAIEAGYLTAAQLEDLLVAQKSRQMLLSQAIIEKGYLTIAQLEDVLIKYKQSNQLTQEQFNALENDDYENIPSILFDFSTESYGKEMYAYLGLVLKSLNRFVGVRPALAKEYNNQSNLKGYIVSQRMDNANIEILTIIHSSEAVLVEMAKRFSGDADIIGVDEYSLDCVAEFLNTHNGLYCVNMSDKGVELELYPQNVTNGEIECKQGFVFTVSTEFGPIYVYLQFN